MRSQRERPFRPVLTITRKRNPCHQTLTIHPAVQSPNRTPTTRSFRSSCAISKKQEMKRTKKVTMTWPTWIQPLSNNSQSSWGRYSDQPESTNPPKPLLPSNSKSKWRPINPFWITQQTLRPCLSRRLSLNRKVWHGRCKPRKITWCWRRRRRLKRGWKS